MQLDRILNDPIAELVDPDDQVIPPASAVSGWQVPEPDRRALLDFGLPRIPIMKYLPEASPPAEAVKRDDEVMGYLLGRLRILDVFAAPGTGAVQGVSRRNGRRSFLNSSAASYVEISWRMYHLRMERYMIDNDEEADLALAAFLRRANEIDPQVGQDETQSYWAGEAKAWAA
ncbi:SUKH-4 family immunity protein [Glycomyces buryatensis]|uniref:Uncharacterized protein n=1 Tax=Glycomyces buryatensis TaxID=2570927 RepID=A0A4S8Q8R8_9ACTN|nr:SUKH-4 family immunity protein [Glycomyces buryatensis]THV40793.1 hypothetical protein FAB82_14180 [Glycomyces buryatensis]